MKAFTHIKSILWQVVLKKSLSGLHSPGIELFELRRRISCRSAYGRERQPIRTNGLRPLISAARLAYRKFLRLSVGNSAVADDLTQETFLHLWRRPASFNPERGGIKAYLLGIARKKAADWWRHNRSDTAISAEQPPTTADCLVIRDALNRLPEDMRTVLWLREVESYSYEELADILKIPVGTVRPRLHAARQQLRTIWLKEIP